MIELRWAQQHRGYIEMERVLQYRTCDALAPMIFGKPSVPGPWSEWQDVPEVFVPNEPPTNMTSNAA